jgi:hypothetical protein
MRRYGQTRERGAAIAEFLIAVTFVLMPLMLGTWQYALLAVGKDMVNLAALMAARAAAVEHGSVATMRREIARTLVPLYGEAEQIAAHNSVAPVLGAYARAIGDLSLPHVLRLEVLNPTRESFADFERERYGVRGIPNDHLEHAAEAVGVRSRQTLLDANTLSVRVAYCHRLIVPLAREFVPMILATLERDPLTRLCYSERRVPVVAHSVVMMQSEPRRAALGM